ELTLGDELAFNKVKIMLGMVIKFGFAPASRAVGLRDREAPALKFAGGKQPNQLALAAWAAIRCIDGFDLGATGEIGEGVDSLHDGRRTFGERDLGAAFAHAF